MAKAKKVRAPHTPKLTAIDIIKHIGPGLLVTVGFIDPGNWATNIAAGSEYGYRLLWVVTLSTFMLIVLQHNVAHLGIVTGYCLSEMAAIRIKKWIHIPILVTSMFAAISTALAELLGGAIALQMLFHLPLKIGAVLVSFLIVFMLFTNSYNRLEKWIIGFVSLIGLSFIIELVMAKVDWGTALSGSFVPSIPHSSIIIIMSILGAVVMPHNLFLHSEIIQGGEWHKKDVTEIERQLKYEFTDTLVSMLIGWAINSAMIIIAAATFFKHNISVTELSQAQEMLKPLLGKTASILFAIALLMAGIASSVTAGMAGGTIYAGIFKEPYDIHDSHSKWGVGITIFGALIVIFFIADPFKGLVYSQMLLSMQLPITIFLQLYLTSKKSIMGKYANHGIERIFLWLIALLVTVLNAILIFSF